MDWYTMDGKDKPPTMEQMRAYVDSPLWDGLHASMQAAYGVQPRQTYSGCSGQPGWNLKYSKGGKSICTLYPMRGFFIALIVVGEKEKTKVELMLPTMTPYTQALYESAGSLMGAKWLMMHITGEEVLEDAKRIMAARRAPQSMQALGLSPA